MKSDEKKIKKDFKEIIECLGKEATYEFIKKHIQRPSYREIFLKLIEEKKNKYED